MARVSEKNMEDILALLEAKISEVKEIADNAQAGVNYLSANLHNAAFYAGSFTKSSSAANMTVPCTVPNKSIIKIYNSSHELVCLTYVNSSTSVTNVFYTGISVIAASHYPVSSTSFYVGGNTGTYYYEVYGSGS